MTTREDGDTIPKLLAIVDDLLRGARHSRRSIAAKTGKSPGTADRWMEQILEMFPNARKTREGNTTWLTLERTAAPSKSATLGACIAASLGALFEGTEHERNLKDARDAMLRQRGDHYPDLDRKFIFAPRGGEYALPENGGNLDEIIESLLKNKLLSFSYRSNDGKPTEPKVEPLSLVVFDHQFYLLARKPDQSLYCYRFARMSAVESSTDGFAYPSKNEYNPRSVLEPGFGIHIAGSGPIEEVEILLSGPWANYAKSHRWHPTQQVTERGEGSVAVGVRVRLCREVETWVLGFGEHAAVVRPLALREAVATRIRKAAARYARKSAQSPSVAKAKSSSPSLRRGPRQGSR
jgi:predicted DNA-binding transcriptional regulator YafY